MELQLKEFSAALGLLKPAIDKNSKMEFAKCFMFYPDKVMAYGNEMLISIKNPYEVKGMVKADALLAFLKKIKGEKVELGVADGDLTVTLGKEKAGFRLVDLPEYGFTGIFDGYEKAKKKAKAIPEGLVEAMKLAAFCTAPNSNYPNYRSVYVKDGYVNTTDGYRIYRNALETAAGLPEFLLPANTCKVLESEIVSEILVSGEENANFIYFTGEDYFLAAELPDSLINTYPDVEGVMRQFLKGDSVKTVDMSLPDGLFEALEKAKSFLTDTIDILDQQVDIEIKKGRILVKGQGLDSWYKGSVSVKDYTGPDLVFSANPHFMADILPNVNRLTVSERGLCFSGEKFDYCFARKEQKK